MKKYLHYSQAKLSHVFTNFRNRFRSPKSIFEGIYHEDELTNNESVSGSGSTLESAKEVMQLIPAIIGKYGIRNMLDIPCGDFNWMKEVDLANIQYLGADIVGDLITANTKKYANEKRSFFEADLTAGTLPAADLVFCRDCLVHLSNRDVWKALANIRNSGSKYLLTTTFTGHQNQDITTGNWRPLNLTAAPFNLPAPVQVYMEKCKEQAGQYADKALCLWNVNDIPAV